MFKKLKPVKVDKLCLLEIDLIASNLLDFKNSSLL